MMAIINDRDLLHRLQPLDVGQYLSAKGWQQIHIEPGRTALWTLSQTGDQEDYEVLLPLQSSTSGYAVRMAEVLETLAIAEHRTQIEIYEDLILVSLDVARARLLTEGSRSGMIPIDDGPRVFQSARDMILAAACATIQPRMLFPRRKPERAMEYLRSASIGTKAGSFVLMIASRIQPSLQPTFALLEHDEPFERKVMLTLASAITAAYKAAEIAALGAGLDAFRSAVEFGASANLCESLVGLYEGCGQNSVEFSFSFSPLRKLALSIEIPDVIRFTSDRIGYVKEAARIFREIAPIENTEIQGYVTRLDQESVESGKITIAGTADGKQGRFLVKLDEPNHKLAINAYENRLPVTCIGELQKEGRSWVLKQPHGFGLLPED